MLAEIINIYMVGSYQTCFAEIVPVSEEKNSLSQLLSVIKHFISRLCTYFRTVGMLALSTLYNHTGSNRAIHLLPTPHPHPQFVFLNAALRAVLPSALLIICNSLVIWFCLFVQRPLTIGIPFSAVYVSQFVFLSSRLHSRFARGYRQNVTTPPKFADTNCVLAVGGVRCSF